MSDGRDPVYGENNDVLSTHVIPWVAPEDYIFFLLYCKIYTYEFEKIGIGWIMFRNPKLIQIGKSLLP